MHPPLHVVILAAGQGSRMKSRRPKVLHRLAGKPLLHHVIDHARQLSPQRIHIVIGHGGDQVRESTPGEDLSWAVQSEQLGTGHAVAQALPDIPQDAKVLVLYGDVPLTHPDTLRRLSEQADEKALALLTVTLDDPTGYGRILRTEQGQVTAIVEHKDADERQRQIREVNTGLLATTAQWLNQWLPALSSSNAQGEYYLTDIIAMAVDAGLSVRVTQPEAVSEVEGINNRAQLATLERVFQRQQAERLMAEGISLADPQRLDVRGTLTSGPDTWIDVGCVFEGRVVLGRDVSIGTGCVLKDTEVADGAVIEPYSVLDGARVGADSHVGPFARLRPGTDLGEGAKVGNFVETKKAIIGAGSKVNHLSYVGDTRMGEGVNVGAGTITCNYDGVNKHQTQLDDGVFVGSNTSLVAPVRLGRNATTGAGSTITKDVAEEELAIARGRQRNISGWKRPQKN